jgi:hypothetical protein
MRNTWHADKSACASQSHMSHISGYEDLGAVYMMEGGMIFDILE